MHEPFKLTNLLKWINFPSITTRVREKSLYERVRSLSQRMLFCISKSKMLGSRKKKGSRGTFNKSWTEVACLEPLLCPNSDAASFEVCIPRPNVTQQCDKNVELKCVFHLLGINVWLFQDLLCVSDDERERERAKMPDYTF